MRLKYQRFPVHSMSPISSNLILLSMQLNESDKSLAEMCQRSLLWMIDTMGG